MRSLRSLMFVATAVSLVSTAACSDDDPDPVSPSSITVQSSQTTATIVRGGTITVPVTGTRSNYGGTITYTAENLPTGVTVTFDPATVTGTATSSTATIVASGTATTGTSNITIKASGTGVTDATSTIALTVNAAAGVTLGSGITTAVAAQGAAASVPIFITRTGDFTGAVNLVAEGLPTGVTATFAPATIASGARVTTLTLNAAGTAAAATTPVTIRATGTGITDQTQVVNLTVNANTTAGFGVSASPAALVLAAGQSGTTALALSRQSAFAGNVQFVLEGAPTGVTATFTPNPATAGTSAVTINTTAATAPGTYQLTLRGTSAGVTDRSAAITLIVTAP